MCMLVANERARPVEVSIVIVAVIGVVEMGAVEHIYTTVIQEGLRKGEVLISRVGG